MSQTSVDQSSIDAAIRKLSSSSYLQRELGCKQIEEIGIPALEALRRASKSVDAETKHRLEGLISNLEEQLRTKQILKPKEVHLQVDGFSVQQAIAELARISGYSLQFQGDATKFADKKITLDTGTTSFWQAFDQLCDQAGLMERVDLPANPNSPNARIEPLAGRTGTRAPSPIVLMPRTKEKSFVSYAGAAKTEMRVNRSADSKELTLTLIVSVEPPLLNAGLAATPRFDNLADGTGRGLAYEIGLPAAVAKNKLADEIALEMVGIHANERPRRHMQIRIKDADLQGRELKDVIGRLSLQLDLQNEVLAKIEKILEAGGKSADGSNGGSLKVGSVKKLPNGNVEVHVAMENLTPNPFGGNVIVNGGNIIIRGNVNGVRILGGVRNVGAQGELPDLVDAKGQKYRLAAITSNSTHIINGAITRNATIVFQPNPGQTNPSDLILFGTRTHTIAVPFRFADLQAR